MKHMIEGVLVAAFVFSGIYYICNDTNNYKVKPCEVPTIEEPVYTSQEPQKEACTIEEDNLYTEAERELLARVIMSEGSNLPYHGKLAIMGTIINRVNSDKFPNTIEEVIYQENQYSTSDNGTPTEECYTAIDDVIYNGSFPPDMFYFRTDKPHSFGFEYLHIGNTFFNTETQNIFIDL